MKARVLVAVVSYNSAAELPEFLASLQASLTQVPHWRVVIADNASTDNSAELAANLAPYATVVHTGGNFGYAAGINACLSYAEPSDAVLVLNPDVRLEPDAIQELLRASTDPSVGISVPVVYHPDGQPEATLRRRPTPWRILGETLFGHRAAAVPALSEQIPAGITPESIDWANGAVLLLCPGIAHRIGLWREDLFLYSEETDYCRRVTDAGWRIVQVPQAKAQHRGGEVTRSPALWAQLVTNKVVHLATWESQFAAALGWVFLTIGQLLRLPLRRKVHRRALQELLIGRKDLLNGKPTNPAADQGVREQLARKAVNHG